MSDVIDLRIDSIAAGGDGVGRHHGMVVFVPRTAPGDLVRVVAERKDRLARGRVLEVLEPSADRVEPPCIHYVRDRCGGCQLQQLSYDAQLRAKEGIIQDSMARIGRVPTGRPPVQESPRPWRYRRKLTLALRRREGRWIAGLHRFDAPDDVFAIEDCPITEERVLETWTAILAQQRFLPRAHELRGAVREVADGFSFTLEGGTEWPEHLQFVAAVPGLTEVWWIPDRSRRRLLHPTSATDRAGASFVQVNPAVTAQLRAWVLSLARAMHPSTVIDAYAGVGDLAAALAESGADVVAIEVDRAAARVAGGRLPPGSRSVAAPVERALRDALPAELVILNPPRAGVDATVTELLNSEPTKPKAVLYVSCNPATLARDVRRLHAYRVRSLRGFDMFPQTAHVETVCELVPAA